MASHVTVIALGADGFVATCLCGWRSDAFKLRRDAAAAARIHRANMTVQDL